jgi:hypothetical protein
VVASIQKAQARCEENFDYKAKPVLWRRGDWVLVHFPGLGGKESCQNYDMVHIRSLHLMYL